MHWHSNVQKVCGLFGMLLLIGCLGLTQVHAGVNGGRIIYNPEKHVSEGEPIYIEAGFTTAVEHASVYYRFPTDPAFTEVPMILKISGKYGAMLKREGLKKGTMLEYYIVAETADGQSLSYPEENPEMVPLQLIVSERSVVQEAGIETVVLSPEPGSTVNKKDFIIAISLFSDDSIDVTNLKLTLDGGDDVTKKSDITQELVTYSSKSMAAGAHAARLWYTLPSGDKVILTEFTFDIALEGGEDILSGKGFTPAGGGQLQGGGGEAAFDDGKFRANFRSEYKGQNNLGVKTNYKRVGADLSYEKKFFQVSASFDWDSEDDPTKNQPLSRYLLSANVDNVVIVNYGDSYPTFSPVTLYGTRVRGLSTGVYLGIFNFEFVKGSVNRKVLSKADKGRRDALEAVYNPDSSEAANSNAVLAYLNSDANVESRLFTGTFEREMTAGRFSIGPQAFQFGLSYLQTGDKESSLYKYTPVSTGYNGVAPQENVVFGADFKTSLFSKRVNFDASIATSLTNTNITGGGVDARPLGEAGIFDTTQISIKDMNSYIDMLSNFITVNPNLSPILVDDKIYKDKNIYAYTFGGSVSAFDNNFSVRYKSNGGYFQTFGSSIQRDIKTFEISDRQRFWQNRIFVTVNYATSQNNLSKLNANTLKTNTLGFNASLFLPKLPSLSIGYTTMNRDNNWNYTTDSSGLPEKSVTNIVSLGTSYSFAAMDLRHNASVNYSYSKKDDKSQEAPIINYTPFQSADNNSLSMSVTTEWKFPLRTTVNFSTSAGNTKSMINPGTDSSAIKPNKSSATGFGVSGDYQLLSKENMMMNVYGGLAYAGVSIPNSSDLSLTSFNVGQRFNFYQNHTFTLNFNVTTGLKIPKFDALGNRTGTSSKINSLISARYEYFF